jgi:hypothetical protein
MSENEPSHAGGNNLDQPLSEEEYSKLTSSEKYAYAKRQTELRAPNTGEQVKAR